MFLANSFPSAGLRYRGSGSSLGPKKQVRDAGSSGYSSYRMEPHGSEFLWFRVFSFSPGFQP